MPIGTVASGNGYDAFGVNFAPAITCSGTCAAGVSGYSASVGGNFAGTAAASAGLVYNIWPNVGGPFAAYNPNHIAVGMAEGLTSTLECWQHGRPDLHHWRHG